MDKYEIYCSEEQTWKAFELGAPIKLLYEKDSTSDQPYLIVTAQEHPSLCYEGYCYAKVPTAAQMIHWLEEQEDMLDINIHLYEDDGYPKMCGYGFTIYDKNKEIITGTFTEKGNLVYICPKCKEFIYLDGTYANDFLTKKEATLEAIDAALEYLTENKK